MRTGVSRCNFAFLDAEHTFEDVINEYNYVKERQKSGDMIFFDDVTPNYFNGVVKAIMYIENEKTYRVERLCNSEQRGYAIAKKL